MIGIHINSLGLSYKDQHENRRFRFGKFNFCISFHPQYNKEVVFEDKTHLVIIDGWIFNAGNYSTQAQFVYQLYKKHGNKIALYLNGQFNICIIDKLKEDFIFINDIYAFRKHFYCQVPNATFISSDFQFINENIVKKSFNIEHLSNNIVAPRIINEYETFIKEISQIPSCTFFCANSGINKYNLTEVELQYPRISPANPAEYLENIKNELVKVAENDKTLLHLSGGIDSRFLLELLIDCNISLKTLTYGIENSDEVLIARMVAEKAGVENSVVPLLSDDFILNAEKYINQTGGLDIFVQSAVYSIYTKKNDHNLIIDTGFALDAFLGGTQIDKKIIDAGIPLKTHFSIRVDNSNEFSSYNRIFSILALRQSAHREFLEDRYSMYSYPVFFAMKNLPAELIKNYKFYYELLKLQVKKSFNIPILSTMFDLSLAPEKWKEASKIQSSKEEFVLNYFKESRLPLYHNRYYSDFDMWLRSDKTWINAIQHYLLDDNCLIEKMFIPKEFILKTVDDHMTGTKNNLRNIIRWISTEIFLRQNTEAL